MPRFKATGDLGSKILQALLDSQLFEITILTRKESKAKLPETVRVIYVDYSDIVELTSALEDQDAVVSVLTTSAMETQLPLLEASVAAGVKRFIPSEFCSDIGNSRAATLPAYASKVAMHPVLAKLADNHPDFSYSLIRNGPFLDWSLAVGFFLNLGSDPSPMYDGGDCPFSTTTLATIGKAVVGVLCHVEETKNRAVYVHDLVTTQRQMLQIAKKLAPTRQWETVYADTAEMEAAALEKYSRGEMDLFSSMGFFCRSVFGQGYGGEFSQVDNELLGISLKNEADLENVIRTVVVWSSVIAVLRDKLRVLWQFLFCIVFMPLIYILC